MTQTAPQSNDFVNPDPTSHSDETNRRVYELLSQGHSWLGLQTLYALADSGINDSELMGITERMRVASVRGVQAGALQPGLVLAKQGTDYQASATASLRGGLLDTKNDISMPGKKGLRPRTLNEQDASTHKKRQRIKQIKDAVTQADDGFKHFFDDPVLQKNPSAGLALARYLNGVLGPVPIKEPHLKHIQEQLQLQGFGRGLPVDGVMSPAWGAAQNQWKDSIYKSQLKGDKPGSISLGHALQALQALTPVSAWDAIIGYAKQLPAGARQLLGDVAGSTVQFVTDITDPNYYAQGMGSKGSNDQVGYDVNAAVVNTLGGDTSAKEVKHAFQDNGGLRLLEDVSNLIMVSSLVGTAGRFGSAAGIEAAATTNADAAANLTTEAAFRGPGVIAKSLAGQTGVNPAIPRAVLGAGLGAGTTALAGGTPLEIGIGGVVGGTLGAASNTQVFQNIPILGETGPFIESLASGDGLYYKVRQFVHSPYTWVGGEGGSGPLAGTIGAAARLGDTAFNQSLLLGGEAQGLAQLQDWVGGDQSTGFSKGVEREHSVDSLNDAIGHRLGGTVLGVHIAPSINDLMFVFGGRGAEALRTTSSKQLEEVAARVAQASTDALGDPGYAAAIARATASTGLWKRQPTLGQMIERAGGQDKFNEFWGDKIRDVSASWGAERELAAENAEAGVEAMGSLSDQSRVERLVELKHEILHDPERLQSSMEGLRAQAGGEELVVRLKRDIAYGSMSARGPQNVASDYIDAKRWFRDWIHPTRGMKIEQPEVIPAAATGIPTADNLPELFHGSSSRFNAGPSIGGDAGAANLLGPGFYATDNLEVANTYMRKGRGAEPSVHSVRWNGEAPPRIIDADAPISDTVHATVADWWRQQQENEINPFDATEESVAAVDEALANRESLASVIGKVRAALGSTGEMTRAEATEFMDGLAYRLDARADVLRYSGGARTGSQAHNAYVFLDPDKLSVEHVGPHSDTVASPMWANAPSDPNNFGFASIERKSVQQANREINDFQHRWDDLLARENADPTKLAPNADEFAAIQAGRPTFDEYNALESEMFAYLHEHLGVHGPEMPQHGTEMIGVMREQAKLLGADVYLHPDAPDVLKEAVEHLKQRGYKPFAGTDIGYHIANPSTIDATEGPLGFTRRVVEHMGLNPTTVPNAPLGTHLWTDTVAASQRAVDHGEIAFPAGADPVTMLSFLQQEGVVEGKRGTLIDALGRLGVKKVAKDLDVTTAEAQDMIDSFPVQFRDWSRKKFVEALSGPRSGRAWAKANPGLAAEANRANPAAHEAFQLAAGERAVGELPPMSRAHAERFYQILVDAAVPDGYYAGAAKIEDLFRAGFGFAGKVLPQNRVGWSMANLPNRLIQLRNELRFDLSPAFSFRRWFKSNVKGALEGIPPVWDPVEAMQRDNSFARSREVYERVRPGRGIELDYLDSASRYLKNQDIFGLYNGAMTEARAAGIWAKMGKTDEEINRLLTKTFEYGSKGVEGRSALERSTNFVFFPFSFEKTLYRNLGGYLLDKPAQRLVLTRALAAYDDFNKNHMDGSNPLATSFYEKHLPILEEAARLNAFSHGLSLGEPGGINRPLLNLFLPQSWNASQDSLDSLHRFVPVIADFQRILSEANDQTRIIHNEIDNLQDDLREHFGEDGLAATQAPGGKYNAPGPRKTTLTTEEEINEGFKMQLAWINDNKKFIDYNAGTRDPTDKYRFPLSREWGRLAGQPITAQNIRKIVSYKYPAFKAESAVTAAVTNSNEWNDYVLDSKGKKFSDGKPKYRQLVAFQTAVKDFAKTLVDDRVTSEQRAQRTDQIRAAAIFMAEEDEDFYRLYRSNFQKYLGPLESVSR